MDYPDINLPLNFLDQPPKTSLVILGSLSLFFAKLSTFPTEHTLQDIHVLTNKNALVNYLGWDFQEISFFKLSISLAAASYAKTKRLFPNEIGVGVGCTIPLTFNDHSILNQHKSCYITTWSQSKIWTHVISLHEKTHTQESKDAVLTSALFNALNFTAKKPAGLRPHDTYYIQYPSTPASIEELLNNTKSNLLFYGISTAISDEPLKAIFYPHSLLPQTYQGWSFLNKVKTRWKLPIVFELVYNNEHYGSYLFQIIKDVEKLGNRLIVTKNLSFGQKAKLFNQSLFIITEELLYEICQDDLVCMQNYQCQFLVINTPNATHHPQIVQEFRHLFIFSNDEPFTR